MLAPIISSIWSLQYKGLAPSEYVYAWEPVDDVMHAYRCLFLIPNMADTTHTGQS